MEVPNASWIQIRPLFVLVIAISGNFLGNTFSCPTRRLLTEDLFVRHALLMITIYVTLETQKEAWKRVVQSVGLWLLFLLFTKMDARYTLAALAALVAVYELEDRKKGETEKAARARDLSIYVQVFVLLLMVVGVTVYARKQRLEHAANWSWSRFFFGASRCGNRLGTPKYGAQKMSH